MKDIAVATGVSVATVSNAFNHPERLSESKRNEIFAVAASLGYGGPHPGASSLRRSGMVGAIGFMITDWLAYAVEDPASTLLLQGIAHTSQMTETILTLLPFGGAVADDAMELGRTRAVLQRAVVDGFIAFNLPDDHPAVRSVLARGAPLITVDAPKLDGIGWVGIDERAAARTAADHLLTLGHKRIGILVDRLSPDGHTGPVSAARLGRARDLVARERLRGYADAFETHDVSMTDSPIVEAGGYSALHARRAAGELADRESSLTAVLATSDMMAIGLLDAFADRNTAVPDAVSVIGFDDIPAAEARRLTTVHQPLMDKGKWAAEMLFAALHGAPAGQLSLPWHLQIRRTTAPPPSERNNIVAD